VLLTGGLPGVVQQLSVRVYGRDQAPLAGVPVTLTQAGEGGGLASLDALTGATGVARFAVVNPAGAAEYVATAGAVQSNAIEVTPLAS
jgi:hypothetical protein